MRRLISWLHRWARTDWSGWLTTERWTQEQIDAIDARVHERKRQLGLEPDLTYEDC